MINYLYSGSYIAFCLFQHKTNLLSMVSVFRLLTDFVSLYTYKKSFDFPFVRLLGVR